MSKVGFCGCFVGWVRWSGSSGGEFEDLVSIDYGSLDRAFVSTGSGGDIKYI